MPRPLNGLLTASRVSKALFWVGQERFEQAKELITTSNLNPTEYSIAQGGYLIGLGEFSAALEVLRPASKTPGQEFFSRRFEPLRKRLIAAASSELTYLTHSAKSTNFANSANSRNLNYSPANPAMMWLKQSWSVLHVLGTSLPNTQAGYTMRTQFLLRAIADQGVSNAGITRYLYPVDRAVLTSSNLEQVQSVTYLRELPTRAPADREGFHHGWANYLTEVTKITKARLLQPTTDFNNGRAAMRAASTLGLPVIYEVRGFLEESAQARKSVAGVLANRPSQRYELTRQSETAVMLAADAVTTLSETMKTEIVARGVSPKKIHVMPNGVPAELLITRTDSPGLRTKLKISRNEFVIGVITTFSAHEGLPTLIQATGLLKEKGVPVKCVLVGDGPTWPETKKLVDVLGLSGSIYLPGRVKLSEVAAWYQLLDLFVLPRVDSRVTQLVTPLKPLEAMALGVPVVGSDVAGIREVIEDGVTGALFMPDDPIDCANKIEELLYDSTSRDVLTSAGRAWVSQQRTWAMIAKRYVSLYQELGAI